MAAGETFSFRVVLIGEAIGYLPYFILAVQELGRAGLGARRGQFDLLTVDALPLSSEPKVIFHADDGSLSSDGCIIQWHDVVAATEKFDPTEVTIEFITPGRFRYGGTCVDQLDFHILARNLLRRIAQLSHFHCKETLELDFRGMIERATAVRCKASSLHWYDWSRFSTRQRQRMALGGLLGSATFSGTISEFLPFLFLGQIIHAGKGTTFGLGRYRIISVSTEANR